ncbi:ABC transporter ATP-binding protein [Oceanobacillus arenosus]|uniref:ABC transporter ATP-binding protein n=1 Tax=Oceanobacillus arenosus TaxID=1229153 RepID=A0A3D8PRH3_9BACI|nr:ABC transporter ATP-binding protein [Oceanobacillus arenosus]RDW17565.1 ABC transporter ATP-binding protein [Oceanobacillus arenosus]
METILEAKDVSKTFVIGDNNQQTILKSINMQMKKGEMVAVMGPSGSGKSTLLYNISGMDRVTSGSVRFNNREISSLSEKNLSNIRLNRMGFIFQDIYLLKNLSIFDNIVLSAYLAKNESRDKINQRALELMKKMGIAELANHDITQASGGQLQRVAICRALINQPDIVFGDEPTGALNSKAAADIMKILAEINEAGTTIMLVTHDVKIAAKTERVFYMLDGNIVGENQLGKYKESNNDSQIREEILSNWLRKMDF